MHREPAVIDADSVKSDTRYANIRCHEIILYGDNLITDIEKPMRIQTQLCKVCYYAPPRISDRAMTNRACGICGEMQQYSNTATDKLCGGCARFHGLCKRCSSDIELNEDRVVIIKK